MEWLWYVLYGVGGLVALLVLFGLVMYIIGRGMPEEARVSVTMRLNQPAEKVYAVIADPLSWPTWDPGVDKVEQIPMADGGFKVRMTMGRNVMTLLRTRHEPPHLLEMTIQDEGANIFSGSWRHEISAEGDGCVVKLTEDGKIRPPMFRAMARKLFDPAMYLKRHFRRLAAKFGEEPRVS